jgi:hypothetical protein
MWEYDEPHRHATFSFENLKPDRMTLKGTSLDGHQITASLRRMDLSDPSKFLLINRGLQWVNPYPFRR